MISKQRISQIAEELKQQCNGKIIYISDDIHFIKQFVKLAKFRRRAALEKDFEKEDRIRQKKFELALDLITENVELINNNLSYTREKTLYDLREPYYKENLTDWNVDLFKIDPTLEGEADNLETNSVIVIFVMKENSDIYKL